MKYFGNQSTMTSFHIDSLEEKYKTLEFENDDDVGKITLVYIYYINIAMMGKNKQKGAVEIQLFKDVEDIEYFNILD